MATAGDKAGDVIDKTVAGAKAMLAKTGKAAAKGVKKAQAAARHVGDKLEDVGDKIKGGA